MRSILGAATAAVGCVSIALVATACGSSDGGASTASSAQAGASTAASTTAAATKPAAKACRIGLSFGATGTPAYLTELRFAKETAQKRGCELVLGTANGDPAKQFNEVQQWIQNKQVDAITMLPIGGSVAPLVKQAQAANIPIVGWGGIFPGAAASVEADHKLAGTQLADTAVEWVKSDYKGQRKDFSYAILTYDACGTACKDRTDTMQQVLKAKLGVSPVTNAEAITVDQGLAKTEQLLQAHPDVDMILSVNDAGALGALKAVQQAGREKDVFIGAVDGEPDALAAIAKGGAYKADSAFDFRRHGAAVVDIPADILEKGSSSVGEIEPVLVATPEEAKKLMGAYAGG